jgi:large subunit ribosomal protein L4
MELKVTTLDGKAAGSVQLSDAIFGLEPRKDLIQRCVNWQLAKRQAGTHKTQGRADVWRTGKKMYKQKGTGGARHGSARVPQFRGGGRAFGPVVRSQPRDRLAEEGSRAGASPCALGQGQGRRPDRDRIGDLEAAKTKALIATFFEKVSASPMR